MNPNAKQCKFCLTIRRFGRYEEDAPNCKNCGADEWTVGFDNNGVFLPVTVMMFVALAVLVATCSRGAQ